MQKSTLVIGLLFSGLFSSSWAANDNSHSRPSIESLDTDGDGAVSFAEFQEGGNNLLTRLDTDQNDVLTLDEFLNARPMGGRRFGNDNARPNSDNSSAEFSERRERMQERMIERNTERFHSMDTDGDEVVTLAELQEATFLRMDRDNNGLLEGEELEPPRRGGPGGHRGGGPRGQNGGQSPAI